MQLGQEWYTIRPSFSYVQVCHTDLSKGLHYKPKYKRRGSMGVKHSVVERKHPFRFGALRRNPSCYVLACKTFDFFWRCIFPYLWSSKCVTNKSFVFSWRMKFVCCFCCLDVMTTGKRIACLLRGRQLEFLCLFPAYLLLQHLTFLHYWPDSYGLFGDVVLFQSAFS